jgi:hypothetical protein
MTATPDFQRIVAAPVYDCGTASALARLSASRPMTGGDHGVRRCPAPSALLPSTSVWLSAYGGSWDRRDAMEDAMPVDHARKKAIRDLKAHNPDLTYTEAAEILADPANQLLCETCGWTLGMICPECPGCGCYNGRCTGWRHGEYAHEDDRDPSEDACDECGGSFSLLGYDAGCICD